MPEMTEKIDEEKWNMVPREQYRQLVLDNPGLQVMPKEMRQDLPPLPCDINDKRKSSVAVTQIVQLQKPAVAAVEQRDYQRHLNDSYE